MSRTRKLKKLVESPHLFFIDAIKNSQRKALSKKTGEDYVLSWKDFLEKNDAQPISVHLNEASKIAYFDIKAAEYLLREYWHVHGHGHETLACAKDLIRIYKGNWKNLITLERLQASIFAESGQGFLYEATPPFTSLPIGLVDYLYKTNQCDGSFAEICHKVMQRTRRDEGKFEAIARSDASIAIVGNSPIGIGSGKGDEIDSHDIVIRFNNYSIEHEYTKDYGKKTNIWVRAGKYMDIWRRPMSNYDLIVFSGPDKRYHSTGLDIIEAVEAGVPTACIPARIYSELAVALDYPPSAGLLILYWLRKIRGSFSENNVNLYGFSMSDQSQGDSVQYFNNKLKREKYRHNWEEEARFLKAKILS
ncbi:MAG: hypothetical protein CMH30_09060 [Micavibrio sp.]|nr:hypothetical protein [Micavibrio sp.]|tara:strand:- start:4938 stop:6023 length:1086 start_codon:yes stop_codon:yes gene_type:complete